MLIGKTLANLAKALACALTCNSMRGPYCMDHVTVPCPRKRPISKRPITSSRTTHSLVPESPHRDAPRQQNRPITSSPPLHVTESPHASKIAPSRNTISRALENAPLKTPHHVIENAPSRDRIAPRPTSGKTPQSRDRNPPCPRKRPISKRPITSSAQNDAPRQQNRPITSSPPHHVTESPHATVTESPLVSKIAPSRHHLPIT